ncbi:MAG: hypothetical protein EBV82_02550 [Chitinophagia bacterium]|nr:hypothetical protein [Chitinophagia bacterium]
MKYQVGDEILVLHSNEEGRIIEIMNDQMVMIEVRGVKFPAYMDQIDFPYFKRFTQKKLFPTKESVPKIYVDQIPKEKIQKNDSKDVHDIPFASVNDGLSFAIDFSLQEPHKKKADHFETNIKIKPKQLFQRIEAIKEENKSVLSYALFETYPDKVEDNHIPLDMLRNAGFKVYDAAKIKQHLPAARSVVDLHIEKLVDKHSHLTNSEIMHIQLTEFEKWFELAQLHHLPNLVIIHGVGTGKLKAEIHELLKVKKGVKRFINQYSDFYGYGATEVFFE